MNGHYLERVRRVYTQRNFSNNTTTCIWHSLGRNQRNGVMVLGLFLTQKSNELLMQKSVCITEAEVRVFLTIQRSQITCILHFLLLTQKSKWMGLLLGLFLKQKSKWILTQKSEYIWELYWHTNLCLANIGRTLTVLISISTLPGMLRWSLQSWAKRLFTYFKNVMLITYNLTISFARAVVLAHFYAHSPSMCILNLTLAFQLWNSQHQ